MNGPQHGFNGELHEASTRWQLLGNGRRSYAPALLHFSSADRWSPFGAGGINAYAYCGGDPINRIDPDGRDWIPLLVTGLSTVLAVSAGVGASSTKNPRLQDGLVTLATLAGLIAATSFAAVGGRWLLRQSAAGSGRHAKYKVSAVPTKVQRNPGGSYLKGQPRRNADGVTPVLKTSFNRLKRQVSRKVLGKPRFRYRKAPVQDAERIRKLAPVERRALLASGYRPMGDKPDAILYLDSLGRHFSESVV